MKYNNIYELNQRGRATVCPQCQNEDISDDADYCEICGASLINRCTNPECKAIGSGKARFCKKCGSETEFGKNGYLKPWNYETDEIEIDELSEGEIEINIDELEGHTENMVEIEIAQDDEYDNGEDNVPEIDHSNLGDLGVMYDHDHNHDNHQDEETYDKFQEFSYKGGDEFFDIF